jgi:cobyrinic acid a,c-diamide synthase
MHQFLISAAHKSSGKTTLSIGLAAALRARGLAVQTFKKGPDYIDPLWLGLASGHPCHNLDFFLSPHEEIAAQYARHAAQAEVCLVEGNKGLYDGLALDGANSNAALAHLLQLPVLLVLDARGMTRGIAPLILGYQAFDRNIRIAGVILNRLGGSRHEAKLRAVIEHYTDVAVVGAVAEDAGMGIIERHLGLMPANESNTAVWRVEAIAGRVAAQVDLDCLLTITRSGIPPAAAGPLPATASVLPRLRLAVAQDEAFGFYYAEDMDALVRAGAEIIPFDTLRDARLPAADALFIGGGFPECAMDRLAANASLRTEIRDRIEAGMPAYAECGGLMYLARSLNWKGETRPMVGVIPADIVMHDKPVGRGYVRLAPTAEHPWADDSPEIRCHEFHYSSIENLPVDTRYAYRVLRGHGADGSHDGIVHRNLLASYSHLRCTAGHDWAQRFVAFARRCIASQPALDEIPHSPAARRVTAPDHASA